MKFDVSKNVEIVVHDGIMKIYVEGTEQCVTKVNGNAAIMLGTIVGTLQREGVIV